MTKKRCKKIIQNIKKNNVISIFGFFNFSKTSRSNPSQSTDDPLPAFKQLVLCVLDTSISRISILLLLKKIKIRLELNSYDLN